MPGSRSRRAVLKAPGSFFTVGALALLPVRILFHDQIENKMLL
jgi:hypothetical protein